MVLHNSGEQPKTWHDMTQVMTKENSLLITIIHFETQAENNGQSSSSELLYKASNNNNNNNNITEILKYVTWDREVYPIRQGIPKLHLQRSYQGLAPQRRIASLCTIGSISAS